MKQKISKFADILTCAFWVLHPVKYAENYYEGLEGEGVQMISTDCRM